MAMIVLSVWTGHHLEIATLMVLLVVHELGHVTAAWSYGWRITALHFLPFGGVAEVDDHGYTHWQQEIVVALAGPFYHLLLIAMGFGLQTVLESMDWGYRDPGGFSLYFVYCNIFLASFNLLPVYPLDGGRIVQALLSLCMPWRRAWIWTLCISMLGVFVLLVLAFSIQRTGVAWHFVGIAVFLGLANWRAIRDSYYRQLRFLLYRFVHGPPPRATPVTLCPDPSATVEQVLQLLYRERHHMILIPSTRYGTLAVMEASLLKWYFRNRSMAFPLRDLLLSWYTQGRSCFVRRGVKGNREKEVI